VETIESVGTIEMSLKNLAYQGFGTALGVFAALALYMLVGLLFFIPGFLLFSKEEKKTNKSTVVLGFAIVLMLFGVILMGGAGLSFLLDDVSDLF
jgi:hypothetical protein